MMDKCHHHGYLGEYPLFLPQQLFLTALLSNTLIASFFHVQVRPIILIICLFLLSYFPSGSLHMSDNNSTEVEIPDMEPDDNINNAFVLLKFDMHVITSTLSEKNVDWISKPMIFCETYTLRDAPIAMPWRHNDLSVVDPPHRYGEYDKGDVEKLREVVITLHKLTPSLLYVWKHDGHQFLLKDPEGKVVTIVEFLCFFAFSALVDDYADLHHVHESYKDVQLCYDQCKKKLAGLRAEYEDKLKAYDLLLKEYNCSVNLKEGMHERIEELEKEKKDWLSVGEDNMNKIKRHEAVIAKSERYAQQLRKETILLSSVGKSFRGTSKGYYEGTSNLDLEAPLKFQKLYDELFSKRYSYVDNVINAYHHSTTDLQSVLLDEEDPTPGEGPQPTN
nr:hypothetical protein [Tanacetum cinerariifolium]